MKIRLISDAYQKETIDIQIKTRILQVIFILMSFALFGGAVKNVFLGYIPMAVFEIVLIVISITVIVLQYKGMYRLGWSYALSMGFLIAFPLILSREMTILDMPYTLFCFSIIILLLGYFAVGKAAFFITTPIIYGGVIFILLTRAVPAGKASGTLALLMDMFYSMLILLVLAHALSVVAWYSNKKLVTGLKASESEVKSKMKALAGFVHSLSDSMDVGSRLNASAESISDNLKEMETLTKASRENQGVVEENIDRISGFLNQIIEANEGVKNRINNQAVAFEQTTAAIAQMSSSIENMSASANEKIEKLTSVSATVQEGIDRLGASVQIFDGIIASINQMSEIVSVIEDISERTNLLAMNASIESVHAGEAGKGFSIVAQSIRNLSEETSKNSKIISTMIKKNIQDVKNAVIANAESSDNIKTIGQEIVNISSSLAEINQGLSELSQGTGEINKAVYHVVDLKKEVDISTEKMSKIIDEEAAAVEDVKHAIGIIANGINAIDSGLEAVRGESDLLVEIGKSNEEALASLQEKTVDY